MPVLQEFVPYHTSVLWDLHDRYFAQRGVGAWEEGEIPSLATSSVPQAEQHASMVAALAADLGRPGLCILEVGGGSGAFAANLLAALRRGPPAAPRAWEPLRYLFSDYAATTVREAAEAPRLAMEVERGLVVPALFDLRSPSALVSLDGQQLDCDVDLIALNYVACATQTAVFQKREERWFVLCTRLTAPDIGASGADILEACRVGAGIGALLGQLSIDTTWREVELAPSLGDPWHATVIREATSGVPEATLTYPLAFAEYLRAQRRDAHILVSDFGTVDSPFVHALVDPRPRLYGNSLNHGVAFALVDHIAAHAGYDLVRTRDTLASTHQVLLRRGQPLSAVTRAAFEASYVARTDGADFLDLRAAARSALREGRPVRAARYLRRALTLAPGDAVSHFALAKALIEAERPSEALAHLEACSERPATDTLDWEFERGRARTLLGDLEDALAWYRRSLDRDDHPSTRTNCAILLVNLGRPEEALAELDAALRLDPEHARAREVRTELTSWLGSSSPQ